MNTHKPSNGWSLAGRTALVTGGAGGIGSAICRDLAGLGARVLVVDLNEAPAKQLADELPDGLAAATDLGDPAAITELIETVEADLGGVDILVNNAGVSVVERFVHSDMSTWDSSWRINLRAPMQLAHGFLPGMAARRWGRLVFISSDGARAGSGGEAVYSACKAGLLGLSKTLAREAAATGVTSNVVCPGPTDTPMLRSVAEAHPNLVAKLAKQVPLGRLGRPDDVAATVAFLCTERAGYITGQTHSVNGGITMN
jgi:2-hydroxycyclohexanecarboxyl-CoA dehydrogenase